MGVIIIHSNTIKLFFGNTFFFFAVCLVVHAADKDPSSTFVTFNGPYIRGLSTQWQDNSYGLNQYKFLPDSMDNSSMHSAQQIVCTSFSNGGVQIRRTGISVERDSFYTIFFWIKGNTAGKIYVGLRSITSPYTGYVKNFIKVTDSWLPYVIIGKAEKTDKNCGLFIMLSSEGSVSISAIEIRRGVHRNIAEGVKDIIPGNLITNSGFEVGVSQWSVQSANNISHQFSHTGNGGLRVRKNIIESQPVQLFPGKRYVVSAHIRSVKPQAKATISLMESFDDGTDEPSELRDHIDSIFEVSSTWKRYSFSENIVPVFSLHYNLRIISDDEIHIDDVQLEEQSLTQYRPKDSVEIGISANSAWYFLGDTITLVSIYSAITNNSISVSYSIYDFFGNKIDQRESKTTTSTVDTVLFVPKNKGIHRIIATIKGTHYSNEIVVSVIPNHGIQKRFESIFGSHFNVSLHVKSNTVQLTKAIGVQWVRLHDFSNFCQWYRVEPQKGKYIWYDAEVEDLYKNGFSIIGNLGLAPQWAGRQSIKRKDYPFWTNAYPNDLTEWRNYIRNTVHHYKDKIKVWEIWNEPYGEGFFDGTAKEYVELLQIAFETIKSVDSTATVIGGCVSLKKQDWIKEIFRYGALDVMDAISYHQYWDSSDVSLQHGRYESLITQNVSILKNIIGEYNSDKPILMTEGGVRSPSLDSWVPNDIFREDAISSAFTLVKGLVQMQFEGVQNIIYYFSGYKEGASPWYSTSSNGAYVLLDQFGKPKPTLLAYRTVIDQLSGATPYKKIINNGYSCYLFRIYDQQIAVIWSEKPFTLQTIRGDSLYDIMGNLRVPKIVNAGEPVFFHVKSSDEQQLTNFINVSSN